MTLEEAIKNVKEVVIKNRKVQYFYENNPTVWNDGGERMIRCRMCADEHEQLVNWLTKLKAIESAYDKFKEKAEGFYAADDEATEFIERIKTILSNEDKSSVHDRSKINVENNNPILNDFMKKSNY